MSLPSRPIRPRPSRMSGRSVLTVILSAGLALAAAVPARAADPTGTASFTPEQRQVIVAIVRQALKDDPSILEDAVAAVRASAQQREAADTRAAVQAHRGELAGQPGDAVLGNPAGSVTVVEFYDPRCPYCRKVVPDLDALTAGDRSVRLVEKLIPILGPNSVLDAQAIQAAASQGRYVALQHALMTDSGAPGLDRIRTLGAGAGLDVPRLLRDMKSPAVNDVLQRNVALAKTIGLTGTPTFIIGRETIPGAVDLADLRQAVQAARAE